jgi:hypothetical protein
MQNKPLLSLFTPTNNPKFLNEVYDSLQMQDYDNWEWVIGLNGDARDGQLTISDPRIRLFKSEANSDKIGALKYEACNHCKGDAFIEMDHDDLLVPGALSQVAAAIADGAGFVYSDVAVFEEEDLSTWGYHTSHGWEHYPIEVYGKRFVATKMFDLHPRMLCEVYYAPDHVRVWSREAYYNAGGHDTEMSVGDDHDLICRTYLSGAKFHYTDSCCYLYRYHQSNTVKLRNQAIQTQVASNRRRHLMSLISEWCRRDKLPTLDLMVEWAGGRWAPHAPKVSGMGQYGQIVASDVMQLIPPQYQVGFMNSCYDALVPGGWLNVRVPDTTPRIADPAIVYDRDERGQVYASRIADPRIIMPAYADMNPTHLVRFNENSFIYYTRKDFAAQLPGVKCRFDQVECSSLTPDQKFMDGRTAVDLRMTMLRVDLCALKDDRRYPGPRLI